MKPSKNVPETPGDPQKQALLVIDVQQGLFRKSSPIYRADELLHNIQLLVDEAHHAGIPVIYVQHSDQKGLIKGSQDWQLHSQLQPTEGDIILHKLHGNAFEATDLGELLKARNVGSLVITGLVTHGCVKATCLGAKELGYRVTLVSDGHSNYSKQAAEFIATWNQKLAEDAINLKSTSEILF